MAEELTYKNEAAAGYDRAFAHITTYFVPFLLRGAHLAPGMRVLDIASGTGLAAEAALKAQARPDRRLSRFPRTHAMPCARKCGATSATPAGRSK